MSDFDVPAARALCDAATKGPWCVWDGPAYVGGGHDLCIGSGGDKWIANMDERNCRTLDQSKAHGDEHDAPDVCPICSLSADDITKEQRGTADFIAASRTLLPAALDEIERLRKEIDGYAKECREVENALGAALGFPRYCDDKKNFPDATEKDGYCAGEHLPGTLAQAAAAEIERLRAALAVERKACDSARRLMATPGTRSCPLCSATIPRDHDHRLATTQYARDWCAAHDARREGETL